ncbi:MAG: carbohydrate ABC transporter permease [Sphaerochaeta sp.]|jgi:raffinose/stachyose/melibiose transport system permease protein|nr:carbohydrate ABC transporter permease [Sphaerochaeta sp.]
MGRHVRYGVPEVIITIILILLSLTILLPMLLPWMFVFKTQLEYAYDPWAWPKQFLWSNFQDAWEAIQIGQGLLNTLIVSLGAILVTVPSSALAGYVFAKYRSKTTEILFYAILIGYFIPIQMGLIPLYKLNIKLGLSNTLIGLILPMSAFLIPFWTLIYRSFFAALPNELSDAARIDGAGHWATLSRIMLPLANPATVLALLLVFISAWSDYFLSLIMLNDQKLFTMQLRVSQFLNAYGTDRMPRYAAAVIISMAPTIIMYLFGHRWILQGTLAGAIKE